MNIDTLAVGLNIDKALFTIAVNGNSHTVVSPVILADTVPVFFGAGKQVPSHAESTPMLNLHVALAAVWRGVRAVLCRQIKDYRNQSDCCGVLLIKACCALHLGRLLLSCCVEASWVSAVLCRHSQAHRYLADQQAARL